jgi:iron complex outermembrane recepter protein
MVSDDNNKRRRLLHRQAARLALLFAALAIAGLACHRASALAQSSDHGRESDQNAIQLDIPPGPIGESLMEFAVQTHFSVAGDTSILKSVSTRAVSGRYSAVSALQQMLSGTGLTYELIADKSAVIRKAPSRIEAAPIVGPTHVKIIQPDLQDMLVTIEGQRPPKHPSGSYSIVLDRATLDTATGQTLQDVLRSRPDIFGGGPTEDTVNGREASNNNTKVSGINLRGLDAGATLVLINGRRIAPSGAEGGYGDVANIPLSAIERIEITPEGAAIRYGTDAPGGVVDLIMREGYTGKEAEAWVGSTTDGDVREQRYSIVLGTPTRLWGNGTLTFAVEDFDRGALPASKRDQATSDLLRFNGQNFNTPFGNPGTIVVGAQTWPIPHGQDGIALPASALAEGKPNLYDQYQGATVLPSQHRLNGLLSFRQTFDSGLKVFADALMGKRSVELQAAPVTATLSVPSDNPYYVNPTGGTDPVEVEYGFGADLGPQTLRGDVITRNFAGGFEFGMESWAVTGYAGYSSDSEDVAIFNQVDFAALNGALTAKDTDTAFNPFGDGSHSDSDVIAAIRGQQTFQARSRLRFGHLSSSMPVLAGERDPVWINRIDATAGFRYDRYSDVGATSNPTFGLSWSPTMDFTLRGTWARAFRPPNLPERVEVNNVSEIVGLPDAPFPALPSQCVAGYHVLRRVIRGPDRQRRPAGRRTVEPRHGRPCRARPHERSARSDMRQQSVSGRSGRVPELAD